MNLSINTYDKKPCTNMYFQGARPLQKTAYPAVKNGADTFKASNAANSNKESLWEIVRNILGEMIPKFDPDYRKVMKSK